jgi:type II secretory pathway pseudopilin PulG
MSGARRGFSIIETVLAIVVGGLVMLGCVSVFLATSRAERAFGQRYQRTNELWTTQLAVRRAFLQLLMEEQAATPPAGEVATESTERPRLILEADLGAPADEFGVRPHRFEVTVARSPVPSILGSQYGSWLVEADRSNSLDFASTDVASGAIRGVFELRPAGTRELIMINLALSDPDPLLQRRMETDPPAGWTLWWRPILSTELAELQAGGTPRSDVNGSSEEIRTRLAGAIPVLTGIETMMWRIFKSDQMVTEYSASTIPDLPAYAQLEIILLNGQYANWLFEVGWTSGEDPTTDDGTGADPDSDTPNGPGNPGGPGNPAGPGNPGNPGGPGGPGRPGGNRPPGSTIDVGGGNREGNRGGGERP